MSSNPLPRPSAFVAAHVAARRTRPDRGQTTSEYALVLLGAAAIALLLVAWATGSGKVDQLFNAVFDRLISHAR
jgi:hypothetical protein